MEQKELIISKVNRSRKGTIFLPDSFLPIDPRHSSNILAGLAKSGKLVRVSFGIYVKPEMTSFGPLMPTTFDIAKAVARRDNAQILPSGPAAENYLGLSTQVPMNSVYLTSGSPRKLKIGDRRYITLKHSVPSTFAYKGEIMPILVLALKSIKRENINEEILAQIKGILMQHPEENTWRDDLRYAPNWIRRIITDIKNQISS